MEKSIEMNVKKASAETVNPMLKRIKNYLNKLVSTIATSTFDDETKTAEMLKVENASNEFVSRLSSILGELEMMMMINVMDDNQKEELKKLLK